MKKIIFAILSVVFTGYILAVDVEVVPLPVKEKDALESYPFTIQDGKFYQLVDNERTEEWELHKIDISR